MYILSFMVNLTLATLDFPQLWSSRVRCLCLYTLKFLKVIKICQLLKPCHVYTHVSVWNNYHLELSTWKVSATTFRHTPSRCLIYNSWHLCAREFNDLSVGKCWRQQAFLGWQGKIAVQTSIFWKLSLFTWISLAKTKEMETNAFPVVFSSAFVVELNEYLWVPDRHPSCMCWHRSCSTIYLV